MRATPIPSRQPKRQRSVGRHRAACDGAEHRRSFRRISDDGDEHQGAVHDVSEHTVRASDDSREVASFHVLLCEEIGARSPRFLMRLRWSIGALLFLSTVINYIDRQTLSVLGPTLKTEYRWSNADFALDHHLVPRGVHARAGRRRRFLDRVGTRTGLTVTVAFYSIAAMLTSLAGGLRSFCFFRFLLGAGEAGKLAGRHQGGRGMVSAARERLGGRAVRQRLVDRRGHRAVAGRSACSTPSARWRPAFLLTGALGFLWLLLFRWLYHPPETHPRISEAEREYISPTVS